jgi:signal transduction histidine kinase/ActR/RegA family two-component response regulator
VKRPGSKSFPPAELRGFLEQLPCWIARIEPDLSLAFENRPIPLPGPLLDRFAESDRGPLRRALETVLAGGQPRSLRLASSGEQGFRLDLTLTPFMPSQRAEAVIALGIDASLRQSFEERFIQSAKLEALSRLAGGVAHDFNDLLTVIVGNLELHLGSLPSDGPDPVHLRASLEGARRAASLTHQLLMFGRKSAGAPVVIDVQEHLRASEPLLHRLLGESFRLRLDLGTIPCTLLMDPGQWQQILAHLTTQARDGMPPEGTLRIILSREGPPTEGTVVLSMRAEGWKLPSESIPHLFDPFTPDRAPGGGSRLGLAIVQEIVRQAGGEIRVESRPEYGTEFQIRLPASLLPAAPRPVPCPPPQIDRLKVTIFVVEDEAGVRLLAREVLENEGYRVLEARNGPESLRLSQSYLAPIHLLVTDVMMPMMNGRRLVEELRKERPDLKVLYTSGYTDDEGLVGELRKSSQEFMSKPYTPDQLLRRVRELLDPGTVASP